MTTYPHVTGTEPRHEWADTLRSLAFALNGMADALMEDDGILGALSGQGLANHFAELPWHIREVFKDCLSDEAVRGYRADQLYALDTKRGEAVLPKDPDPPAVLAGEGEK